MPLRESARQPASPALHPWTPPPAFRIRKFRIAERHPAHFRICQPQWCKRLLFSLLKTNSGVYR